MSGRIWEGWRAAFSCPSPFHSDEPFIDTRCILLLYTVNARPGHHLTDAAIGGRCLELLRDVGLADKATRRPRDLTQVEMRKLELARAGGDRADGCCCSPTRGRWRGRVGIRRSRKSLAVLLRLNEPGHHDSVPRSSDIMSAVVMSFSTRLMVLVAGHKIAADVAQPQQGSDPSNPEASRRAYLWRGNPDRTPALSARRGGEGGLAECSGRPGEEGATTGAVTRNSPALTSDPSHPFGGGEREWLLPEGYHAQAVSPSAGINAGYGSVRVIENVSLSVSAAATVALLGTNVAETASRRLYA